MNERPVTNLFDITVTRNDMYRAAVFPGLYPEEKPMRVGNWHAEDREMYCGGPYVR